MSGVQSIERAFSILRTLAQGPVGVTDIAERTELPKSTVSRLLAALEAEGAVEQQESGGEYGLGSALATLAEATAPRDSLRAAIRPFIEELAVLTGGSAGFTVLDGDGVYWVDNVDDGDQLVLLADQSGSWFPLHTVASGIALMSVMTDAEIDDYLSRPLEPINDDSITDVDELRSIVASAARDGVVRSRETLDPGVNVVAAPFRGPSGAWAGGLYLQGPSFRFPNDGDDERVVQLVTETAAAISERFAEL